MTLDLVEWAKVVKKKRFQSTEFKSLNTAVKNYILQNDGRSKSQLEGSWTAWTKKFRDSGKTYKDSDRYLPNGALDAIHNLFPPPVPPRSALPAATTATPSRSIHPMPMSEAARTQQLIQQRNALNPSIRSGGNDFQKVGAKWTEKVFTQQQSYSCTCACATTFLSKLTGKPVTEDAFKSAYCRINGAHDFSSGGTEWPPIVKTLLSLGADVVFMKTNSWGDLKKLLDTASTEVPILFGIEWQNGGSPGGGHAIICTGKGPIPNWPTRHNGYLIEDPYWDHDYPGMIEDAHGGHFYVKDKQSGGWPDALAKFEWGCIVGKKTPLETVKMISHLKGRKVM